MRRLWKISLIGLLALLSFAPAASARGRFGWGGGFYYPYSYGWYGPGWYGSGWYGPHYGYYSGANAGNVKIKTEVKDATMYVDGGYAGPARKLKKFALRPGIHDIALRDASGRTFYQERVDVLLGKTVEIRPDYTRH